MKAGAALTLAGRSGASSGGTVSQSDFSPAQAASAELRQVVTIGMDGDEDGEEDMYAEEAEEAGEERVDPRLIRLRHLRATMDSEPYVPPTMSQSHLVHIMRIHTVHCRIRPLVLVHQISVYLFSVCFRGKT
jgi:hypothetical protein